MSVEDRLKEEQDILKIIRREIIKCAKKGELHYYWDISDVRESMVKSIVEQLEKDGKMVNSKGTNYKIIKW